MQVPEPSTLTKPGPNAAQGLPPAAPFNGSNLSDGGDLSGLWELTGSARAAKAGTKARIRMASRMVRIPPFNADDPPALPDEPDANSLAPAPDHLAASPRPGVAR